MTLTLDATRSGNRPARTMARREIAVFLGATAALTVLSTTVALAEGVDVRHIEDASALGQTAMYVQALFPFLGALLARLSVPRASRGAGWGVRRTPWASIGIAWGYGLVTVLAGACIVWAGGLGGFRSDALDASVLLGLTVLVLPYVVLALAEDLGWRGLLVTRLAEISGPRTVVLLGGLAWSAFHWPLIALLGGTPDGVSVWFALVTFTVGTIALGAVLASMQLRWGIWPGVVAHAVVNATLYHVAEPLTREGEHTAWFATETGVVTALVGVLAAWLWWRRAPLVRRPDGSTATPAVGRDEHGTPPI